jgi:DNA-binding CsgD family transcriptional regulator
MDGQHHAIVEGVAEEIECGADQAEAVLGLLNGILYYLEDNGIDPVNQDMNGQRDVIVANVAEMIEGNTDQAEAVLATFKHIAEITSEDGDSLPLKRPELTTEAQQAYRERVYLELGRIASVQLPDVAITGILGHFRNWTYDAAHDHEGHFQLLRGQVMHSSEVINVSDPRVPRRKVLRDEEGLAILVENVTAADLRYVLNIERLLAARPKKVELNPSEEASQQQLSEAAVRFREAKDVYVHEDDLFTDKESIVMSLLIHFNNNNDLAWELHVANKSLAKTLKPVKERLGVTSSTDLMLMAIAAGVASIDHIPEGKTKALSENDRELLKKYYSPKLEKQKEVRGKPRTATQMRSIYVKLGLAGITRHQAVLYAVKDGDILLPDLADIRSRMAIK